MTRVTWAAEPRPSVIWSPRPPGTIVTTLPGLGQSITVSEPAGSLAQGLPGLAQAIAANTPVGTLAQGLPGLSQSIVVLPDLLSVAIANNGVLLVNMLDPSGRVMGAGNNIDALVNLVTGTVIADDGTPAQYAATGLGGKPCADFGGASAYTTASDPAVVAAMAQPGAFTCYVYGSVDVADALRAFLGAGNAGSTVGTVLVGTSTNASGVWAVRAVPDGGGAAANGNFGANDTSPHLLTYQCTGTVRNLWVDGVADPVNGANFAPTATPTQWAIGQVPDNGPSGFLDGKLCVLMLCDGAHNDATRQAIEAAIMANVEAA